LALHLASRIYHPTAFAALTWIPVPASAGMTRRYDDKLSHYCAGRSLYLSLAPRVSHLPPNGIRCAHVDTCLRRYDNKLSHSCAGRSLYLSLAPRVSHLPPNGIHCAHVDTCLRRYDSRLTRRSGVGRPPPLRRQGGLAFASPVQRPAVFKHSARAAYPIQLIVSRQYPLPPLGVI